MQDEMEEITLLSEKQAAKSLGVSTVTLWRWRKDRKINFHRLGNLVRYSVADLKAFMASKRNGAALSAPPRP
jgi:excisionase family DNA binding protein